MRLTVVDSRPLAVVVLDPASGQYRAWQGGAWSSPFNASIHCLNLAPSAGASGAFANVVSADLGNSAWDRPLAVPLVVVLDTTASPAAPTQVLTVDQLSPLPGWSWWRDSPIWWGG